MTWNGFGPVPVAENYCFIMSGFFFQISKILLPLLPLLFGISEPENYLNIWRLSSAVLVMFIATFFLASLIDTSIDVNFKVLGHLTGPEWLNFKANVYRLTFCQDSPDKTNVKLLLLEFGSHLPTVLTRKCRVIRVVIFFNI